MASLWSPSHRVQSFSADSHTPYRSVVCFRRRFVVRRPYSVRGLLKLPSAQSPFARGRCSRARRGLSGPRQQVLPRRHRSYRLMRQSSPLLVPRCDPRTPGRCRLRSAPAGRRTFPTFSLRRFPCVLGPRPRRLLRGVSPFLPSRQRPSPRSDRVGAPPCPCSDFSTAPFFEAAVLHSCAGPQVCAPPRSLLPIRPSRMAAVACTSEPLVGCHLPTPRI